MAHFIDTATNELVANVLVDTRPRHAEWQPDGKNVWVSSEVGGTVSVIDADTHEIIKVIGFQIPGVSPEQIQPVGMRFSKDRKKAFVALGPANRVAVVNAETFEVEDYVLVGQRPWHVEIAPDGSKLYVANGLTNDMTVVDLDTLKPLKSVPVGRLPWGIAITP
jgi:PQQ-dependent catabolism-associated beta-propeller protein